MITDSEIVDCWNTVGFCANPRIEFAHAIESLVLTKHEDVARLDFVLEHGLPLNNSKWGGKKSFRYHGVEPIVWHETERQAIDAAILYDKN